MNLFLAANADSQAVTGGGIIFALIFFVLGIFLYLLPTFVAMGRHHHNALAIGILNLLLGWTFVGWVVALVWSCTSAQRATPQQPYLGNPPSLPSQRWP
jgi:membrane protein CcdC involved in cytochrome C biogenesis